LPFVRKDGKVYFQTDVDPEAPPAPGRVRLRVESAEPKTSPKGNDYISIRFRITQGPDASKAVWYNGMFDGSGSFVNQFVAFLKAIGIHNQGDWAVEDLVGAECESDIENEEFNNDIRARPVRFYAVDEPVGAGPSAGANTKKTMPW
jgi:hypothetical protein